MQKGFLINYPHFGTIPLGIQSPRRLKIIHQPLHMPSPSTPSINHWVLRSQQLQCLQRAHAPHAVHVEILKVVAVPDVQHHVPDGLALGIGHVDEDVIGEAHRVIGEREVDPRARGFEGRSIEGEGFVPRLAVGVQERRHGCAGAEGLHDAGDLGRAVVEGGLMARDGHDPRRVEGEGPDLET